MVTIVISLLLYHRVPSFYNLAGLLLALVAIFLMAFDEVKQNAIS
jgi:drug/metabolite transporter (DMT)-like permease